MLQLLQSHGTENQDYPDSKYLQKMFFNEGIIVGTNDNAGHYFYKMAAAEKAANFNIFHDFANIDMCHVQLPPAA